jgi:4-hydroxy-3-polyprenylbenzoate decarboxylase
MVLEGVLHADQMVEEGPVSEYHGLYEHYGAGYVVAFSHLTRRRDAMLQVIQPGYYPEHIWIGAEAIAAGLCRALRDSIPGLTAVAITPGGAGRLHAVLAVRSPADARAAIEATWATVNLVKQVTVVDDDVDPWDGTQVELSLATRMRADRDLIVVPGMPSNRSDPQARNGVVPKLGIDATRKDGDRGDWTPAAPPAHVMEKVRRKT